ncbi:hypothetical protein NEMIN01_0732 [Nematocida minor]|uniref:uncharacterized protein n=1 Tax=Nematocida minor TaxID=1912983 RepID=UPI00221FE981|nr:uncharacterized protein NEMIN01_0732 [Nematocida minor]KAI5189869.1 hypothetical protein NEMIN01_0732 [Nematocida minor]
MKLATVLIGLVGLLMVHCRKKQKNAEIEGSPLEIPKGKYKLGIFTSYKPTICGIAQFSENMIDSLKKADPGIEIEVFNICRHDPKPPRRVDGIKVTDVYCTHNTEKSEFKILADYVKKSKFDGVLVNHEYYLISTFTHFENLVSDLKETGTTVHTFLHTPISYPPPDKQQHIRKVAASSDKVIVMSWKAKHYLHHSYGIPKKKIIYFPHGIKTAAASKKILKDLDIPSDKFIVYTDGIMHEQKGVERMINALWLLKQKGKIDNILVLVAGLSSSGTQYMENIERLAHARKLQNNFRWIKKFLSNEEMATLHKRADVYFTLFEEVIPTSGTLTYAMYSGDAIITTPYRYSLELLGADHNKTRGTDQSSLETLIKEKSKVAYSGITVPFRRSAYPLAEAILKYKNNPELRRLFKLRSKERVKQYNWDNVANYIAYYFKTKKNKYINEDPYKNNFMPSRCKWDTKIKTFFETIIPVKVENKPYLLYKDYFVRIEVKAADGKIKKILIEGRKKDAPVSFGHGKILVVPSKHVDILSSNKNECYIYTPNMIFVVSYNKKHKCVFMEVLFENIYGNATGLFGCTLRQKYDLTKPSIPTVDHFVLTGSSSRLNEMK